MPLTLEHNALPGSLELAYLGDTIYDLYVRTHLVERGGRVGALHRRAVKLVCAHAQSEAMGRIEGILTDEEEAVARRARNVHQTPPRSADPAEYHRATALEAVMGYLYATGREDRLRQLLETALPVDILTGQEQGRETP